MNLNKKSGVGKFLSTMMLNFRDFIANLEPNKISKSFTNNQKFRIWFLNECSKVNYLNESQ